MKFTEILEKLKKGEKVTREKWQKSGDSCAINFIMYNQKEEKCEFYRAGECYDEFVFVYEDITAEDWKIYEGKTTQIWKPRRDETYYSIDKCGSILGTNNVEFDMDKKTIKFGNCFKTREKAKHMVEKIKIINKLRELSTAVFGNNIEDLKYSISYDIDTKNVTASMNRFSKLLPFEVYFKSATDCQKAIDIIGVDNLKKYYFDIVEEEK